MDASTRGERRAVALALRDVQILLGWFPEIDADGTLAASVADQLEILNIAGSAPEKPAEEEPGE